MRGINKVIIVGRLGANPETRTFANGGVVTNISVATTEQWKDKVTGEKREATEWHRIALFNRLGEIAAQYLTKGSQVYIEGSLRTRKWTDQNGQERYMTEIRADSLQMLGGGSNQNQQGNYNTQGNYNQQGNYNPQDNYQQGNYNPQGNFNQQGNYNPQGNFNQQGNVAPQNNFNQQGNYNPQGNFNQQGNVAPQQPQAHQVNQGQQATQQVKDVPVANDIPECFL